MALELLETDFQCRQLTTCALLRCQTGTLYVQSVPVLAALALRHRSNGIVPNVRLGRSLSPDPHQPLEC